jgi:hypothetical protein
MATLEELEKRKRQLEAQIQRKRRELAKSERKARNHAVMVAGGLLMAKAPGGDWKSVDWNALAAFIAGHADEISACGTQPLDTDGASKRLREWEKAKRQQV